MLHETNTALSDLVAQLREDLADVSVQKSAAGTELPVDEGRGSSGCAASPGEVQLLRNELKSRDWQLSQLAAELNGASEQVCVYYGGWWGRRNMEV